MDVPARQIPRAPLEFAIDRSNQRGSGRVDEPDGADAVLALIGQDMSATHEATGGGLKLKAVPLVLAAHCVQHIPRKTAFANNPWSYLTRRTIGLHRWSTVLSRPSYWGWLAGRKIYLAGNIQEHQSRFSSWSNVPSSR